MRKTIGALLLGIILIEPDFALAYIDPSAGGLLIQILLGGHCRYWGLGKIVLGKNHQAFS